MTIRAKCALRYPVAEIFSVIKGYYTVDKMGQVCLETQIALAIQFLLRLFRSLKDIQLELEQVENMSGRCVVFDWLWWTLLGECMEKFA